MVRVIVGSQEDQHIEALSRGTNSVHSNVSPCRGRDGCVRELGVGSVENIGGLCEFIALDV